MHVSRFVLGSLENSAYLLVDDKGTEAVAIDAPLGMAERVVRELGKSRAKLRTVILTHGHWDHTADAMELKRAAKAVLAVHEADLPFLKDPARIGFAPPFPVPPADPDSFLKEGDSVALGSVRLRVLHTPGHSPGSICLYSSEEGRVFTGDTLFEGSCGRVDFWGSSEEEMLKSLARLAGLPPSTICHPGHGPDTAIGRQKWLAGLERIWRCPCPGSARSRFSRSRRKTGP